MSIIGNVGADLNPSTTIKKMTGNAMTQEDFMKVLLAQLKMQSPTSPFDSNTMMQQVSQLTSLGATEELAKTVKSLNTNMQTSQVLEASGLVGKHVQVVSDISPLVQGEGLKGSVMVPAGIDQVTVSIHDSNGHLVKTIMLNPSSNGVLDFDWDGLNAEGKPMAPGYYKIAAGSSVNGESIALPVAGTFKVNSVALDHKGNGLILNVDGLGGIGMADLIKIL